MVASTPLRTRVILTIGGAMHGILVLESVIGLVQVGGRAYAARSSFLAGIEESPISYYGLSQAAFLILAVPFGWFCHRLAGVTHPWRAELRSLLVIATVSALLGISLGFVAYAVRGDYAAAPFWNTLINGCVVAGVVLAGGVSFYRIGTREAREGSPRVA